MPLLQGRHSDIIIPEYSLTGDFLSFLRCGLQYRYHRKADWTSPNPTQIWFGEFLHKMMAAGYHHYQQIKNLNLNALVWQTDLRPMEMDIYRQLSNRGIRPTPDLFCWYNENNETTSGCGEENDPHHPHKLLASQRAEMSIKIIGEMIYPFISEVERRLKGVRSMPVPRQTDRSPIYGLTGVVDVISSVNLVEAHPYSQLLIALEEVEILGGPDTIQNFEIIIDYKGMRRPPANDLDDSTAQHHEWQIADYAWLRRQQQGNIPVLAGIVIYVNELVPSKRDLWTLKQEIANNLTDIAPVEGSPDFNAISNYQRHDEIPPITNRFKGKRALKIIPITPNIEQNALLAFDNTVRQIEDCIIDEIQGQHPLEVWPALPVQRNCTLCDFKTFCVELRNHPQIAGDVGTKPPVPPQI
ncbi:MAG: hypothetical protein HeimC3_48530 [Candidatus Heimdallarchaeota archaeon LC_3]|nr:MAG: hypothetical protein HeimC3_48530 [Candidatus Heimdallarchaeota archaeon LC_3]